MVVGWSKGWYERRAAEAGAAEAWLETAGAEDGEDREDGGKKAGKRRGKEER